MVLHSLLEVPFKSISKIFHYSEVKKRWERTAIINEPKVNNFGKDVLISKDSETIAHGYTNSCEALYHCRREPTHTIQQ